MNCKRVEELIPLYVGGDIEGRATAKVQSHLKSCDGCAELAGEYEASRNWLSGASPEFDEALLADMKRGVMRELQTKGARPGWFELMSAALARAGLRPAVAVGLLLVVVGALTIWIYVGKHPSTPPNQAKAEVDQSVPHNDAPDSRVVVAPRVTEKRHRVRRDHNQSRDRLASFKPERLNQAHSATAIAPGSNAMAEAQPPSAFAVESAGMLRIDIQTGDPNIRIIWFAPKEVDGQQTNP